MNDLWNRLLVASLLLGMVGLRLVYVRRYRVSHSRVLARHDPLGDRLLVVATGIGFAVPVALFLAGRSVAVLRIPLPEALRATGAVVSALGLVLFAWTHRVLGDNWSRTLEVRPGHALVDRGPYRWIRHPMYTAIALFEVGAGLLMADGLLLAAALTPFLTLVAARLAREEAMLLSALGDEYRAYMGRTKRLVPGLY